MKVKITVIEQINHQRIVEITEEEYEQLKSCVTNSNTLGSFMQVSDMSCSDTAQERAQWRYGEFEVI